MIDRTHFETRGHSDPVRVLDKRTAHRFLRELRRGDRQAPLDWEKGWAASSRAHYTLGCHPVILEQVQRVLGNDFVLWGATLLRREPGAVHDWHCDIECTQPEGRTVCVWLGLDNCGPETALHVIPGSHRYGYTIQEKRARSNGTGATTAPLTFAREEDPTSTVEVLEAHDGEAVFFDGRIWHGSENSASRTRVALLLQYATPDTPIRIPSDFAWPFRMLEQPLPPCVLVSGEDHHHVNRIVPGPVPLGVEGGPRLTTQIRQLDLPLEAGADSGWQPYPLFHGTTAALRTLSCHVSALRPGSCPHPPHRHEEEEILMVLRGEADIVLPDLEDDRARQRLTAGDIVYYPANFAHTLEGVGESAVNYLMFKWKSDPNASTESLNYARVDGNWSGEETEGWTFEKKFEGSTRWLHRLHCHVSRIQPGAGYPAHKDGYDVAIVVLSGELTCMGETVGTGGVLFFGAGENHDARNHGSEPAEYVVFEFDSRPSLSSVGPQSFFRKIIDPRRWRRKLGKIVRRCRGGA